MVCENPALIAFPLSLFVHCLQLHKPDHRRSPQRRVICRRLSFVRSHLGGPWGERQPCGIGRTGSRPAHGGGLFRVLACRPAWILWAGCLEPSRSQTRGEVTAWFSLPVPQVCSTFASAEWSLGGSSWSPLKRSVCACQKGTGSGTRLPALSRLADTSRVSRAAHKNRLFVLGGGSKYGRYLSGKCLIPTFFTSILFGIKDNWFLLFNVLNEKWSGWRGVSRIHDLPT